MPLTLAELTTLSRLLDAALDLAPAARETWLADLPARHQAVLPTLREMLAEHASTARADFMAHGPKLAEEPAGESTAQPGDVVGPYRLVREIGRGGMSVVWLGERLDGLVMRGVALKMLLVGLMSSSQVERFERERDVLAMLDHPRIARLCDAGVSASGQPFIAMEHVDGYPITEACDARRLTTTARLRLFLQVLAAVAHAHKHLVVHRDIKPSNVFVDAEGQVKLLDFGIAKLLDTPSGAMDATALTREGGCVMTPRYAAPEQLAQGAISTATDVYSLGALLYELLVGAPPHADMRASMAQAIQAALYTDPVAPSRASLTPELVARRGVGQPERLRSLLAGDLDTIVLKALRKAPSERYSSVERFADDIQRFLDHRPIAARPPGLAHRLGLFVRRHQPVAIASAIGCTAALGMAGLVGQQHGFGVDQKARAEAVREFMLDMVESADPDETQADGDVTGKQMVEGGLRRARERFRDRPQLLGEVLGELGMMFQRFGDDAKAARTLADAEQLLAASAPVDDPSWNKVRARLADMALGANDLARAGALANAVQRACRGSDPGCAKARAYAGVTLAQIERRQGRLPEALAQMRRVVADTELGFGKDHTETATAWHLLAVFARAADEIREADTAMQNALALSEHAVLSAYDRAAFSRTRAVLDGDLGHFETARDLLRQTIATTADRGERLMQWRLLSNAEYALGHGEAARAAADEALALASPAATDSGFWFARQAHARAVSLLGQTASAQTEMQAVLKGLEANGFNTASIEMLRAHRFIAEMLARNGDLETAGLEIDAVVAALDRPGSGLRIELGLGLDLQGCIRRATGQAAAALALHRRARDLLLAQLPAEHPFVMRNALYIEQAMAMTDASVEASRRLAQKASAYAGLFDPASTWVRWLASPARPTACPSRDGLACALIL